MEDAAQGLTQEESGRPVQEKQEQAIERLDRLIREMEEREKAQGFGGGAAAAGTSAAPTSPMRDSRLPGGAAAAGPLGPGPSSREAERWGGLLDKNRAEVLQLLRERFPAGYEDLVQQYFEALLHEGR